MSGPAAQHGAIGRMCLRLAQPEHAAACASLVQQERDAFGFLPRAVFAEAAMRRQLIVAVVGGEVIGFVRFNHRRHGTETAVYDICVRAADRRCGVGRGLVRAVEEEASTRGRTWVAARCPQDLPANSFYQRLGFLLSAVEQSKRRILNVWRLPLESNRCSL